MNEEYQSSDCESIAAYGQDGYYPVFLGERFKGIYYVVQKLGWGHFSTVWLVEKKSTNQFYAMKVHRCKQSHALTAQEQIKMLGFLKQHEKDGKWLEYLQEVNKKYGDKIKVELCRPLLFYDNFGQFHRHGKHLCTIFELMGPNLNKLLQHYEIRQKLMPLWLVKKIAREVLIGLVFLHEHAKVIHTDLKPQNIVIQLEDEMTKNMIQNLKQYKVMPMSMKFLDTFDKEFRDPEVTEEKPKENSSQPVSSATEKESGESIQKSSVVESERQESIGECLSASSSNFYKDKQSQNVSEIESSKKSEDVVSSVSGVKGEAKEAKENEDKIKNVEVDMNSMTWKNMPININDNLFFKVADLGNSCLINHHISSEIQTREYRSPEVILGMNYLPNADVFSLACIIFELMTNTYLFEPRTNKQRKKDEDHLFLFMKTLGPFEEKFAKKGTYYPIYFSNLKNQLKHGNPKTTKGIKHRLQKFGFPSQIAEEAEKFLLPMLQYDPNLRIGAKDCLEAPWLWN